MKRKPALTPPGGGSGAAAFVAFPVLLFSSKEKFKSVLTKVSTVWWTLSKCSSGPVDF